MKLPKRRSGVFAIAVVVACGGTGMRATGRDGGQNGVGTPSSGTGGIADADGTTSNLAGDSSQGGTVPNGGSSGSTLATTVDAGIAICVCSSSSNSSCDQTTLLNMLNSSAVQTGYGHDCTEIPAPAPDPNTVSFVYVVVDGEGKVIDNSIPFDTAEEKRTWLDSLADYRWPCLAGQTIFFSCPWGYF